jgi:hypothetical protein
MTDKRIKLGCPFCARPAHEIQLIPIGKTYALIRCQCGVELHGNSKQAVIDKWNARA